MRRFIAFIVLAVSLLGVTLFNIQSTSDKINWSQEFDRGTEVVYNIESRDGTTEDIDMDSFVETIGTRLKDAGATSYNIDYAIDEGNRYEVRIVLGSRYQSDVNNILRSTMSAGQLTLFTTSGDGTESSDESIIRHTAVVDYEETTSQAYVEVEVTDAVESITEKADENGDKLLVLWQGKYEDLNYNELSDEDFTFNGRTNEQLKEKVLAVINLGDTSTTNEDGTSTVDNSMFFKKEVDGVDKFFLRFDSYGYADGTESSTKFTADSAKSFARIFNSDLLDYEITKVYSRTIDASYGENADTMLVWSTIIAVVAVCIYLLISHGLTALSGCVGIGVTTLIAFAILNFFSIQVGPTMILAILCSLTMSTSMLCTYYKRAKEDAYNGRALSKASNEGFRKAVSTAIDSTILLFVLGILLAVISAESLKAFGLFLFITSLLNILFTFLLAKGLNNYLLNSIAADKPRLFALKNEYIADLNGNREKEVPLETFQKLNVKKHSKKAFVASVLGIVVALGSIIGFGISGNAFNYSNEIEYGRIEIRTSDDKLFTEQDENKLAEENFVVYLESLSEEIKVVGDAWVITDQKNPHEEDEYYTYFYANLEKPLAVDSEAFDTLESYVLTSDDQYGLVTSYVIYPGVVRADFNNTLILVAVTLGVSLIYFLIRYRYTFALSSIASLLVGTGISLGLISLFRIEVSSFVGIGLLAGLLITTLLFLPIGNRINQLKNESKVKVTTYAQREEISYQAFNDTVSLYVKSLIGYVVILGVLIPLISLNMAPIYLAAIISLLVNGLVGLFILIPFHLYMEKKFKFSKARAKRAEIKKAKREKLAKANRNRGAEPEEIIIPGIND